MCIIAIREQGIPFPDEDEFRRCFDTNRDGAGFAWAENGKVHWHKGLMTFDEFWGAFSKLRTQLESSTVIFHFRIGTDGEKKSPTHTHPFPVADSFIDMMRLQGEADSVFFHNGIFRTDTTGKHKYDIEVGDQKFTIDPSDTMDFVHDIVYPMSLIPGWFTNDIAFRPLQASIGYCRVVVLNNDGNYIRFGDWKTSDSGIFYSNDGFKKIETYVGKYKSMWQDIDYGVEDDWDGTYYSRKLSPSRRKGSLFKNSKFKAGKYSQGFKISFTDTDKLLADGSLVKLRGSAKPITYCSTLDGTILARKGSGNKVWLYEFDPEGSFGWYIDDGEILREGYARKAYTALVEKEESLWVG